MAASVVDKKFSILSPPKKKLHNKGKTARRKSGEIQGRVSGTQLLQHTNEEEKYNEKKKKIKFLIRGKVETGPGCGCNVMAARAKVKRTRSATPGKKEQGMELGEKRETLLGTKKSRGSRVWDSGTSNLPPAKRFPLSVLAAFPGRVSLCVVPCLCVCEGWHYELESCT